MSKLTELTPEEVEAILAPLSENYLGPILLHRLAQAVAAIKKAAMTAEHDLICRVCSRSFGVRMEGPIKYHCERRRELED